MSDFVYGVWSSWYVCFGEESLGRVLGIGFFRGFIFLTFVTVVEYVCGVGFVEDFWFVF